MSNYVITMYLEELEWPGLMTSNELWKKFLYGSQEKGTTFQ